MASVERERHFVGIRKFNFRQGVHAKFRDHPSTFSSKNTAWLIGFAFAALAASASAATVPKFNWIQLPAFLPGTVLLHFDTDANRTYEIQYVDYAPTNGDTWSILATIPAQPAPNHYVWTDFLVPDRTQRFYRLKVTP